MTGPIVTGLDLHMAAWEDRRREREQRSKAAALGHRRRVLADPDAHPLARTRVAKGLTVKELAERSTVGESTIRKIEAGTRDRPSWASDQTWQRLCLGLAISDRRRVDPDFVGR